EALARRNAALRLAFGIIVGLLIETARGALLPTLAPLIALQLLAALPRPPGRKVMVVLCGATVVASLLAYFIAVLTVDEPMLYLIGVGLLYLWGFALAFRPRLAPVGVMILTMSVVVTGIATASTGAALGIVVSLMQSVVVGLIIVYLAHAALPSRVSPAPQAPDTPAADPSRMRLETLPLAIRAIVATAVMLPAHLFLFAQGTGSILVLMTTATMLRQPGLEASARYSLSYAIGNLIGAAAAAVAMLAVAAQGGGAVIVGVTAAGALLLAWMSAQGPLWRAIMLPGMVAFVVLYGMMFSPLIDNSDVSVLKRSLMVVAGAVYALGAVSVLSPIVGRQLRKAKARAGAP
ncbi:MAG: DUF2955 domain-containing protein, partial [Pseudomonadota bacterium]